MWMMGYNDGGEVNMPDSVNGRKLRPLIPRPVPCTNNPSTTATPPCLTRIHGTGFFAINHHLATMGSDQNKKEFNTQPLVVSSRWNPTPEQLRALEELYRRGTRTPSAEQIQHITAQLRRYGKIEGKNVFYWFQNHKARERQKRRRQTELSAADHQHNGDVENFERKESSGANRTGYEVEQTKNWAPSTNCSTLAEESVSIPRAAKAVVADGWTQFGEGELQYRRSFMGRNATWQMMNLSCPPPTILINNTASTNTVTTTTPTAITTTDPKFIKSAHDLNIFITPYRENGHRFNCNEEDEYRGESQTLQLFPLCSEDGNQTIDEKETDISLSEVMNANFTPYQFFEFLPLKN